MKTSEAIDYLGNCIPFVNKGGCLLAAYAFYLHEKKYNRAGNLQIVQLSTFPEFIQHNREFVTNGNGKAVSDAHFGWTYDGGITVSDSENPLLNVSWYKDYLVIPKDKTDEFCISSLNNGGWNAMFNRECEQRRITEKLEIDLSSVHDKRNSSDGYNATYVKVRFTPEITYSVTLLS
jgi:hypothetical protein